MAMAAAMTFDEVSMERSKSFVKALQELKNLRPQLYSAAEYCEKSYIHSEQKQMVLDNLKDYAVRALVNAVDHLGTVAYKLTDIFDQHSSDAAALDYKVSSLNQRISTCQTYIDKEGLRQQQMCGAAPKLHKHYILPYSGNSRNPGIVQQLQTEFRQDSTEMKPRPYNSVKTLSWHLSSESSSSNITSRTVQSSVEPKAHKIATDNFKLPGAEREKGAKPVPMSRHLHANGGNLSPDVSSLKTSVKDASHGGKKISTFQSFENPTMGHQIIRAPPRTKSMLSAFFVKSKAAKLKKISVI
ncbi:ABI-1-like 1 [Carex rostrata]